MKPIFIFSLPRSGSTLLQRMLCTSDKINSASETWILLPFIYTLKSDGVVSEYWHRNSFKAIADFYNGFPNRQDDYKEELRSFILNLYKKRMEAGADFFLDKTPRYHLICREIIELFPEAKFIFLWRNPLSIVSSILTTWAKDKWRIALYKIDLFHGLSNLIDTFKTYNCIAHSVNYEKLLQDPVHELSKICDYLGVDYIDEMTSSFVKVQFDGVYGDRAGIRKYKQIHLGSIEKWQQTFNNPYRRYWARRYLKWIGEERFSILGYNERELREKLANAKNIRFPSMLNDMIRQFYCNVFGIAAPFIRTRKKGKWYFFN